MLIEEAQATVFALVGQLESLKEKVDDELDAVKTQLENETDKEEQDDDEITNLEDKVEAWETLRDELETGIEELPSPPSGFKPAA